MNTFFLLHEEIDQCLCAHSPLFLIVLSASRGLDFPMEEMLESGAVE